LAAVDFDFTDAAIGCLMKLNDADLKTAAKFHLERGPQPIINSLRGGYSLFGMVQLPRILPTTLVSLGRAQERWLSPILNPSRRPPYIGSWNATAMFMTALFSAPALAATQIEPVAHPSPWRANFRRAFTPQSGRVSPPVRPTKLIWMAKGSSLACSTQNNALLAELLRGCHRLVDDRCPQRCLSARHKASSF